MFGELLFLFDSNNTGFGWREKLNKYIQKKEEGTERLFKIDIRTGISKREAREATKNSFWN